MKRGRPISVLVADDVGALAEAFAEALDQFDDIEVLGTAPNGSEAVRLAKLHRPDIVLMDIRMPVVDGIKATEILAAQVPGTKVLIMSAYEDESLISDAIEAGAVGYLVKGTLVADTVVAIRRARRAGSAA